MKLWSSLQRVTTEKLKQTVWNFWFTSKFDGLAGIQPVEEGTDHLDISLVNLLEDRSSEGTIDDGDCTVQELVEKNSQQGLNVSVANDNAIQYKSELSQQVSYWMY